MLHLHVATIVIVQWLCGWAEERSLKRENSFRCFDVAMDNGNASENKVEEVDDKENDPGNRTW